MAELVTAFHDEKVLVWYFARSHKIMIKPILIMLVLVLVLLEQTPQ
jgi:hypothetical protein